MSRALAVAMLVAAVAVWSPAERVHAAGTATAPVPPPSGTESEPAVDAKDNDTVNFLVDQVVSAPASPASSSGGSGVTPARGSSGEPADRYVTMSTLVFLQPGPDGQDCIATSEIATQALIGQGGGDLPTGPDGIAAYEADGYARCPADAPTAPEVLPSDVVAWLVWQDQVDLPDPILTIAPGKAVTGLPAFLEIDGPQIEQRQFGPAEALGYTITLEVTSSYVVDWGDGTVVEVTSQGGPYPDGDVAHNYQHTDDGNVVTVTQEWTATWVATDAAGTTTTGSIDTPLWTDSALALPVGQIQAVGNS